MLWIKLVFIVLFIPHGIFGQDFSFPKEIDLGKFIVPDSSFKNDINYYINLKCIKLSKNINYIHSDKLEFLYDSAIYYNGNIISSTFQNTFYDDTLIITFMVRAKYLDFISMDNKPLESEFTLYYIKNESYNLDSQSVKLKHYLIQKDSSFVVKESYQPIVKTLKNQYGDTTHFSNDFSYIINNSENDLIVDSVKQDILGKNYFKFLINNNDTLKMPFIVKSFGRATLSHFYKLIIPEWGISKIDLFCHYVNKNDLVLISDTNRTFFDYYDGIYFNLPDPNLYIVAYNIDTNKINNLRIFNFTNSILSLNSIDIKSENGLFANCTYQNTKLPVTINPWSRFDIKDIIYSSERAGKYKLKITLGLEFNKDSSYFKEIVYTIESINKITDIHEYVNRSSILISPNPASDYIEISVGAQRAMPDGVNQGVDLHIYDILGIKQQTSPQPLSMLGEGNIRVDVSYLSPGVYFVRVGDIVRKFVKL